ncbi:hypothetical protein [Nonomuraea diastatica]|nr:hypothetical protein [Nonomuraea diastatica]
MPVTTTRHQVADEGVGKGVAEVRTAFAAAPQPLDVLGSHRMSG